MHQSDPLFLSLLCSILQKGKDLRASLLTYQWLTSYHGLLTYRLGECVEDIFTIPVSPLP